MRIFRRMALDTGLTESPMTFGPKADACAFQWTCDCHEIIALSLSLKRDTLFLQGLNEKLKGTFGKAPYLCDFMHNLDALATCFEK